MRNGLQMRKKDYQINTCTMIHSRIKRLHTEEDTTTKQETIRSQNTISEKDCRDLTQINRQRKHEGFDSLPKVKLCRNRPKGQCSSLPKKRTRETVLWSRLCKGQTRAGRKSVWWKCLRRSSSKGQTGAGRWRVFGRVCEEGCWRGRCEYEMMMMIAFITIKSSLVPLIEGLCAQI